MTKEKRPEKGFKFCPNCGEKLPIGLAYCPNCGQKQAGAVNSRNVKKRITKLSATERQRQCAFTGILIGLPVYVLILATIDANVNMPSFFFFVAMIVGLLVSLAFYRNAKLVEVISNGLALVLSISMIFTLFEIHGFGLKIILFAGLVMGMLLAKLLTITDDRRGLTNILLGVFGGVAFIYLLRILYILLFIASATFLIKLIYLATVLAALRYIPFIIVSCLSLKSALNGNVQPFNVSTKFSQKNPKAFIANSLLLGVSGGLLMGFFFSLPTINAIIPGITAAMTSDELLKRGWLSFFIAATIVMLIIKRWTPSAKLLSIVLTIGGLLELVSGLILVVNLSVRFELLIIAAGAGAGMVISIISYLLLGKIAHQGELNIIELLDVAMIVVFSYAVTYGPVVNSSVQLILPLLLFIGFGVLTWESFTKPDSRLLKFFN